MKLAMLGIVLLAGVGAASATTTTTPSPYTGKMGPALTNPPPAGAASSASDDSSGMRRGTVEQVSVAANTLHVYGQRLNFDARRVKVFGQDGKPASIHAVQPGARVRFTMDPSDPSHKRVAVIYID
jgi:hypothetical protein